MSKASVEGVPPRGAPLRRARSPRGSPASADAEREICSRSNGDSWFKINEGRGRKVEVWARGKSGLLRPNVIDGTNDSFRGSGRIRMAYRPFSPWLLFTGPSRECNPPSRQIIFLQPLAHVRASGGDFGFTLYLAVSPPALHGTMKPIAQYLMLQSFSHGAWDESTSTSVPVVIMLNWKDVAE